MANKFLGQFLLEKGLLSTKQLLHAIELQKEANPPLGQLAIREGFINEPTAVVINMAQQRSDQRFGDLAISMGHMTEQQVSLLFHAQKECRKLFGEILLEQGYIEQEVLTLQLASHAELKQVSMLNIDTTIKNHRYSNQITDILEAIIKNFTRIPKIQLKVAQVNPQKAVRPYGHFIISQTMHVPNPIKVGWIMSPKLMKKIANEFLGIDVSHQQPVYVDAVSEFLNIILGNALVSNGEEQTRLDPPIVELEKDDYQGLYTQALTLTMSAPQQDFTLFFIHD